MDHQNKEPSQETVREALKQFLRRFIINAFGKKSKIEAGAALKSQVQKSKSANYVEAAGATIGTVLLAFANFPALGATVGATCAEKGFNFVNGKNERENAKKLYKILKEKCIDANILQDIFASIGAEIFRVFECQLNSLINMDLNKLAYDAVERILVNILKHPEILENSYEDIISKLTLCVVAKLDHFRSTGHSLNDGEWKTLSLYTKVGILDPATNIRYGNETVKHKKYGYRLPITGEDWSSRYTQVIKDDDTEYFYILTEKDIELAKRDVIEDINTERPEVIIKQIAESVKDCETDQQEICQGLEILEEDIVQSHEVIQNVQSVAEQAIANQTIVNGTLSETQEKVNKNTKIFVENTDKIDIVLEVTQKNGEQINLFDSHINEMKNRVDALFKKQPDQKPISNMTRPCLNYLDRTILSDQLEKFLLEHQQKASDPSKLACILGKEGAGKSELVRYVALKLFKDKNIFWIDCSNETKLQDSLNGLASKMNINLKDSTDAKDICKEIYYKFSHDSTLIVFDNAEKFEDIEHLMPWEVKQGVINPHVIITSRGSQLDWDLAFICDTTIVEVPYFTESQSIDLFRRSLKDNNVKIDDDEETNEDIITLAANSNNNPRLLNKDIHNFVKKWQETQKRRIFRYTIKMYLEEQKCDK